MMIGPNSKMKILRQITFTTLSVFGIIHQAAINEANGVIRNGSIWYDINGDEIWCNGGHMIREGDTFYWGGIRDQARTTSVEYQAVFIQ